MQFAHSLKTLRHISTVAIVFALASLCAAQQTIWRTYPTAATINVSPEWIWINQEANLTATISNQEQCSSDDGDTWYNYGGPQAADPSDYNVQWNTSLGTLTELYGPTTTLLAPGYADGDDERTATITITVTPLQGTTILCNQYCGGASPTGYGDGNGSRSSAEHIQRR